MSLPGLFIFLDESGNFDFSPKGTKHFVLTALSTTDPEDMAPELYRLKHELILTGQDIEYFHATEDRQVVRDRVFEILAGGTYELDAIIVEKAKTHPSLRDEAHFYPMMCRYLLQYALRRHEWRGFESFVIFTDALNINWERGELRQCRMIQKKLRSEFEIFKEGAVRYY